MLFILINISITSVVLQNKIHQIPSVFRIKVNVVNINIVNINLLNELTEYIYIYIYIHFIIEYIK